MHNPGKGSDRTPWGGDPGFPYASAVQHGGLANPHPEPLEKKPGVREGFRITFEQPSKLN